MLIRTKQQLLEAQKNHHLDAVVASSVIFTSINAYGDCLTQAIVYTSKCPVLSLINGETPWAEAKILEKVNIATII